MLALGAPVAHPNPDEAPTREDAGIAEQHVTRLLSDLGTVWEELFPAEQARIMQLLVERVDVRDNGLLVHLRADGLPSLVSELHEGKRAA